MDEKTLARIKPGARVRVFSRVSAGAPDSSKSKSKKGEKAKQGSASSGEGSAQFEGLVIARKHGKEAGATFTVRAVLAGVGVEKIFPVHSPTIAKVEVLSSPKKVHRSKLYFVRNMPGARVRQKIGVSV